MSFFSSPEPADDPDQPHHAPELERRFLRKGVEGMAAERHACSCCGRSPLVGERLREYANENKRRAICDICVAGFAKGVLGEPVRTYKVGASERRLNVSRAA